MPGNERKYFALLILGIITLFLLYAAIPLLAGISGAAILYVLLKPLYTKLLKKTNRKTFSAVIVILISIIVIMMPIFYLLYLAIADLSFIVNDVQQIQDTLAPFASTLGYDSEAVMNLILEHIDNIAAIASALSIVLIADIVSLSINVVIMYLMLFYALTEHTKAGALMRSILPFSEKNASRLMKEFSNAINTTFIGNGAAAIAIGLLLAVGLVMLGSTKFFFWLLIGSIMAFIPVIGIQIIWIPAGIFYILSGDYFSAAAIILWGAFLSYIFDGYVRQLVQKKVGEMHPLISIIGLIIGITYFGITGLIIGPLILVFFVLIAQMFREEYIGKW